MKPFMQKIQERIKGLLLLAMLIIPFFLYAAAASGSPRLLYGFLALMTTSMIVALRSA